MQESKLLGTLLPTSPDFFPVVQEMRRKYKLREVSPDETLGHSSPSITLGIYAHATLDMQDQAARVMDEIVMPIAVYMSKRKSVAA